MAKHATNPGKLKLKNTNIYLNAKRCSGRNTRTPVHQETTRKLNSQTSRAEEVCVKNACMNDVHMTSPSRKWGTELIGSRQTHPRKFGCGPHVFFNFFFAESDASSVVNGAANCFFFGVVFRHGHWRRKVTWKLIFNHRVLALFLHFSTCSSVNRVQTRIESSWKTLTSNRLTTNLRKKRWHGTTHGLNERNHHEGARKHKAM